MPEINSFYNAIVFGTLLSAADKIGLKPILLGRQASQILKPIIENLAKTAIGKDPPKNIEEFIEDIKIIAKTGGLAVPNEVEMSYSENCLRAKQTDCMYLDMAKYGKSLGYDACPMCAMGVISMSLIIALGLGEVEDFKIENNGNTCVSTLIIEQSR